MQVLAPRGEAQEPSPLRFTLERFLCAGGIERVAYRPRRQWGTRSCLPHRPAVPGGAVFLRARRNFNDLITSNYRPHAIALSVWQGMQTSVLKWEARSYEGTDTGRNEAGLGGLQQQKQQFGPGLIAEIILRALFFDFGSDRP